MRVLFGGNRPTRMLATHAHALAHAGTCGTIIESVPSMRISPSARATPHDGSDARAARGVGGAERAGGGAAEHRRGGDETKPVGPNMPISREMAFSIPPELFTWPRGLF